MFATFGIDGFPSDQPRDDAVRRLLETELPPEAEPEACAPPPANAHRYVPQHAEAASTPKCLTYDDGNRAADFRQSRSLFGAFGDDDSADGGLSRFASTAPRTAPPRERAPVERGGGSFDPPTAIPREVIRPRRTASAIPRTVAAASRYAAWKLPASASASTSPSRARPAWGGGGGSRRLEDPESPRGAVSRRNGFKARGDFNATSRSVDAALSKKERARVAASRARAELATVERLRAARELRESRLSAPGGVAPARRFSSQSALASGSSTPIASCGGDSFSGAPLRSSSPRAFSRNAGDRLYRRGVFEREKRARERARELERIAAEANGDIAISRDFSGGMGGVESTRPFGMTNVSRALMTNAPTFESRQKLFMAKRAESVELERLRAITRELEETRHLGKPRITASARAMTRTVSDLSAWQRRRDARLEQARRDREADDSLELTFTPAADFSKSAAAATRSNSARRAPGAWSPPNSPPRARSRALGSVNARSRAPRGAARRAFAGKKEDAVVLTAGNDAVASGPAGTERWAPKKPPAADGVSRAAAQPHAVSYSPKAHEREMARALAGTALAGAAAMARVATTPAAAHPSTAPLSVYSPPANANPFGLTQVTHGETHDTSPSRVPGTSRHSAATDETTPFPDPRAATSLRNSVNFDESAPTVAIAEPSPRCIPIATTRATKLRNVARRLALEEAAAKEAFRPQITAKARALRRPGNFGERLHENASAKKRGPRAESPATKTATKNAGGGGVSRAPALSASAMPSVAGALARQKEQAREERRASAQRAGRATAPDLGHWGAYGEQPVWGARGGNEMAPLPARRLDLRGHLSSARARHDEGPPDRDVRRSMQEVETRAREAWGYYE